LRFSSCHSWLSARTWIRPCIFASSMCNSVVRLKGKRSHTAFLATLPFLGVELPLFSRERAPICLRAKESIASPNASAMCVVPEPGESTKKALSPYTIWSSSRLSTSLQNCAFNREGQSKRIIKSVRKARAQTQWNTTIAPLQIHGWRHARPGQHPSRHLCAGGADICRQRRKKYHSANTSPQRTKASIIRFEQQEQTIAANASTLQEAGRIRNKSHLWQGTTRAVYRPWFCLF